MVPQKVKILNDEGMEVEAVAPIVVSASRATDIPAFYADWFFNRLKAGYVKWRNPYNGVDSYVSFANTRFIVFWSKNPAPLIPYLHVLNERGINCYIQYTLNDYESEGLEPHVPSLNERIDTFKRLSEILGKEKVVWRFDPLVLTTEIGIDDLLTKTEGIGDELMVHTERLVFSFADISSYRKVKSNLLRHGVPYREWNETLMKDFAKSLSEMNTQKGWNFRLSTCAENTDLSEFGISHNRCIDDELMAKIASNDSVLMKHLGLQVQPMGLDLFGNREIPSDAIMLPDNKYCIRTKRTKDSGQRKLCGCIASKDIGQYDTCPHGCIYCYANSSSESALRNHQSHNPNNDTIIC